ncbi:MAG: outer membrane beta-barrel protein [Odoribacter sp.]
MRSFLLLCVLLFAISAENFGQLVRRVDYDVAFALQVGGEVGMLTSFHQPGISLRPTGGLKMTIPFTRKWFLGSEINYSELKYKMTFNQNDSRGEWTARFDVKQIQLPVYVKYMLNCNRASVLFGFYGTYAFDRKLNIAVNMEDQTSGDTFIPDLSREMEQWNAGITIGYEQRVVKHLNVMCRVSAGCREVIKTKYISGGRLFPLQMGLTISYDILRIGDCDCD